MKLIAYIDGSYSDAMKRYAYACVFLNPDNSVITTISGGGWDNGMHNVTGELVAAIRAVKWAILHKYSAIQICYDYDGIKKWFTGEWKTKKAETRSYKEEMHELNKDIQITFQKVVAHTGDMYNELADTLAKEALKT